MITRVEMETTSSGDGDNRALLIDLNKARAGSNHPQLASKSGPTNTLSLGLTHRHRHHFTHTLSCSDACALALSRISDSLSRAITLNLRI